MATLLLTAAGTAIGGPIGGALGALVGRQVDGAILGSPTREGPRLTELAVTTSSYGQPIARLFGAVRVPGTIIWATELEEQRETSGGGKGRPKTATYSYSISFAVALASNPIERLGRIWADGSLLRGAAGDLKVAGELRVHRGHRDQPPDPLMAAALGPGCPAHRGCAYAVFESLELADYGNRIPALTFEMIEREGSVGLVDLVPGSDARAPTRPLEGMAGFAHEGGSDATVARMLGRLYPLDIADDGGARLLEPPGDAAPTLPDPIAGEADGFGAQTGTAALRAPDAARPGGLRYYDRDRDYQTGVQRPAGKPAGGQVLDFPAVFAAPTARALIDHACRDAEARREIVLWRVASLDPRHEPGRVVRVPGRSGHWRIVEWEWRETGVELRLERLPALRESEPAAGAQTGDSGAHRPPADTLPTPTVLDYIELPWDGFGDPAMPVRYVAAAGAGLVDGSPPIGGSAGRVALFAADGAELAPIEQPASRGATLGALEAALAPSPSLILERGTQAVVALKGGGSFVSTDLRGVATGANRIAIGAEIAQFQHAEPLGKGRWRLSSLLRGRGGTEREALAGHPPGAPVVLLDDSLVPLGGTGVTPPPRRIGAIALGDDDAVLAPLREEGAGLRPLQPVHPRAGRMADGALVLCWTRRARGQWGWPDEVELPLVEERERYSVGLGPVDAPARRWEVAKPEFVLPEAERADLAAAHPGAALWVCQIGAHARSRPLLLHRLD